MKKLIVTTLLPFFILMGCEKDPYAQYRDLTVQDYLNDLTLMREVLNKCSNYEIKDRELCEVAKHANMRR